MLKLSPLLGATSPVLGKTNPLSKPSIIYREPKIALAQLIHTNTLPAASPLIQTAKFLSGASPDRLHHSNQQSEIGWDNWQPINRSSDRDNFDYKVDRWRSLSVRESRSNLIDRSSQTDKVKNPELDFFTTVLPTEFAEIDPLLDSLLANSIDVKVPTSTNKDRATVNPIQPQSIEKSQPKSVELDRQSSNLHQVEQIEQQKLSARLPQVIANIQPQQIPQVFPETIGEPAILPESSIALSPDNLGSNTVDDSFLNQLLETSIDLNLDVPKSPELDLTQISRSVADRKAPSASQTTPSLASPSELIPDLIIPNLLDIPTIVNPVTASQVTSLEPEVKTIIIPEAAVSPENITPFTVLEQIATATEIALITESLDRLRADPITPNSIDLPPLVDPQLPEVATTELPLLATTTENIPSMMSLEIEPVRESISDTLPADRSDSPITNQQPSTDSSQVSGSLEESAIANLDVPALSSHLSLTTSLPSAEPAQIAPEIQSSQPLNPATAQLNLAANRSNIDRDSVPSIQLEPANPNIPEFPSTLSADVLPTNLLSDPNSEQIATSPIPIAANLQPIQTVSADTPQLNLLDPASVNQTPSTLEQISTFVDTPTPVNIAESLNPFLDPDLSLAESHLPSKIDPDLTIESIPRLKIDAPNLDIDRSIVDNTSIALTEMIEIEQENMIEAGNEFRDEDLLPIPDQPIADSPQNISQTEHLPIDVINRHENIVSPVDNRISNLTNAIQPDPVITASPEIDLNDNNSVDITIPAPTVGYATGGYVKDASHVDLQSIATSDTVSAMLTPGEFVINAKDAQKNLDLLTHINRGGELEAALPNTEIQPSIIESPPISPDISPTLIQRKRNDSLIAPSLQQDISLQQLSLLKNPGLDTFESSQMESSNSPPIYSSPSMIFRKPMLSSQSQYIGADTPDEWGSIEDLIDRGSNNSDPFRFENESPQQPDLESRSSPSMSPRTSPQYAIPIRGFADGGEVTPSDISTMIEPITQTIESPINNPQPSPENNDPAELEILAREIYHRLRQRLEIERERHGSYSGNLAW